MAPRIVTVLVMSCCFLTYAGSRSTAEGNNSRDSIPSGLSASYHLTPEALVALKARSSSDPDSSFRIYQYYEFAQHDKSSADVWLEVAANQGNMDAKNILSIRTKLILEAAEKGHSSALNQLGTMYCLGAGGIVKDLNVAQRWYDKAVEKGSLQAMTNLGLLFESINFEKYNIKEAMNWYHLAAEKGEVEAQILLGAYYGSGKYSEKDIPNSKKWFQAAAEQGNPYAQYRIGMLFYNGDLGLVDYQDAAGWFRRSAGQGYPLSIEILVRMYRTGMGLPKNDAEADKWGGVPKKDWYPDEKVYCMKPLA